jgi:hypothetical protein
MSNMISKLTRSETELLISCEDRIALGEKTFVDVGLALSEIREKRLYRETHNTFEDYCRQRWGWARQRANQLISAASVVENLTTAVVKPSTEWQTRPLAALPPEKQSAVWEKATAKAKEEGRQVVARDVQEAADEERPRVRTHDEENQATNGPTGQAEDLHYIEGRGMVDINETKPCKDREPYEVTTLKACWRNAKMAHRRLFLDWLADEYGIRTTNK